MKSQDSTTILTNSGVLPNVLASLIAVGIALFSVKWQMDQRRIWAEQAKVPAEIAVRLLCFESGALNGPEPLYPDIWRKWASANTTWKEQMRKPSKILVTFLLGLACGYPIILSRSE